MSGPIKQALDRAEQQRDDLMTLIDVADWAYRADYGDLAHQIHGIAHFITGEPERDVAWSLWRHHAQAMRRIACAHDVAQDIARHLDDIVARYSQQPSDRQARETTAEVARA